MKGFVAILEAFLAIVLIYVILSQVQLNMPPKYVDTSNMARLDRYADDMAFSICGNLKMRRAILNNTMLFDLSNYLPGDIDYHMYAYSNASSNHLLENLVYNYGTSPSYPASTSSCLIAGGPNASNYSAVSCQPSVGGDCLSAINANDGSNISLTETPGINQNFTIAFSPPSRGSIVELILVGHHNQSGTTFVYNRSGAAIASYSFTTTGGEMYVFDLTDALPYYLNTYNVTIKPNVNATYDYAYLNVSRSIYSPRRIVVQVWNR